MWCVVCGGYVVVVSPITTGSNSQDCLVYLVYRTRTITADINPAGHDTQHQARLGYAGIYLY